MPTPLDAALIRATLTAVGELLAAEGDREAIVVAGGATLSLLGIVQRTTSDVDVIARAWHDEDGTLGLHTPEPFPPLLERAIRTVARDFGLDDHWLNAAAGKQWSHGLPPGTAEGITWENYGGGLDVGLVGRPTLIALKLFAAVDRGPASVHFQDLVRLSPTDAELAEARGWVLTQDAAEQWPELVEEATDHVKRTR